MIYIETMNHLNINEIKTHFSGCITKVSQGETIIVCKRNIPIAKISPIKSPPDKKRPIGLAGRDYPDYQIKQAFFDPLPDELLAAFNNEEF